jgi:hypothetical protein
MAMVALRRPALPDPAALASVLRQRWSDKPRFGRFKREDQTLQCAIGEAAAVIGLIPMPIPSDDIEAACLASLAWPEARTSLESHTAHLICSVGGLVEKKVAAFQLTKLVAAVVEATGAAGVYWGAATMVHSPEMFIEQAEGMTAEFLPLYLWIHFGLAGGAGKVSLRTKGMSSLGFMEIEIIDSEHSTEDLVGFAFNTAHYLLDYGPILADGHTFGMSADQKVLVRHVPSTVDENETVYRLHY